MRQYQMFELEYTGETPSGSQAQIDLEAAFTLAGETVTVRGFYDGDRKFRIRYYPRHSGLCTWKVKSSMVLEGCLEGEEMCIPARESDHGMVRAEGLHFRYEDGTRYSPFGTTVYALLHQEEDLIDRTMASLENAPFNKVRLCLFPKHYDYNHNEPLDFAFEKRGKEEWDVHRPDFGFWRRIEGRIAQLGSMGIEADLILFHGYDRWGFSHFSKEQCMVYLDYVIRRLSAFPNVWWSLANEYEIINRFEPKWWEEFAEFFGKNDVCRHMLSCHNFLALWDFHNPYATHCSLQDVKVIRVPDLQKRYGKPVIFDECCYEGDLPYAWGNLSAFELVNRFWTAFAMGGYCTHGETYLSGDEVLWWAKGGILKGESVSRIAYLRKVIEELPGDLEYVDGPYEQLLADPGLMEAVPEEMKETIWGIFRLLQSLPEQRVIDFFDQNRIVLGHCGEEVYLQYMGRQCCRECDIRLPENRKYNVDIIDVWSMERKNVLKDVNGTIRVPLPGREGMAILAWQELTE